MALIVSLKTGQTIEIGDFVTVTLLEKQGQYAKLRIETDKDIRISKPEFQKSGIGLKPRPQ